MRVSVRVPATSANLGPGFDCFGIALPIYNTIIIEEQLDPYKDLEINVFDENDEEVTDYHIPKDTTNIAYKAIELLYNYVGQEPGKLRITIKSDIPMARGLGSSASVIVGAVLGANELLGRPADDDALLSVATEVEGHPDNVTPAVTGGFVISSLEDDGSIIYRKVEWPENWKLTLCIPDYELSTQISRSVLPEQVPLGDATFNAGRCAMFINALYTKDKELMKFALQDRLHQNSRTRLIPGFDRIMERLSQVDDVMGTVLSGAGPSILVISEKGNLEEISKIAREEWETLGIKSTIKTVKVCNEGAEILETLPRED